MLPALFLAHGSPMLAIEQTDYTQFLERLGQTFKPKAIVIFSAHWESEVQSISSTDGVYETIHDFYGFPEELYAIRYPAKGSVQLAERLAEMFADGGIEVRKDRSRGLDHGSWTLLHRMYPQADIPVIQLSVHPFLPPETQFNIGACLRGIGDQGILVIGSGVTVHNLRELKPRIGTTCSDTQSWPLMPAWPSPDRNTLSRFSSPWVAEVRRRKPKCYTVVMTWEH
jgi:4,5-DOPA dioxygenase extradiol